MKDENRTHTLYLIDNAEKIRKVLSGIADILMLSGKDVLTEKTAYALGRILEIEADEIHEGLMDMNAILHDEHKKKKE